MEHTENPPYRLRCQSISNIDSGINTEATNRTFLRLVLIKDNKSGN